MFQSLSTPSRGTHLLDGAAVAVAYLAAGLALMAALAGSAPTLASIRSDSQATATPGAGRSTPDDDALAGHRSGRVGGHTFPGRAAR